MLGMSVNSANVETFVTYDEVKPTVVFAQADWAATEMPPWHQHRFLSASQIVRRQITQVRVNSTALLLLKQRVVWGCGPIGDIWAVWAVVMKAGSALRTM